ncbi:hypothetical protein [Rhizobium paranaense]|uniref:Uncharacterized protein n=1 Tax=Rhizobium paranaense TaxID=1650438 RepID=A0A7W8XXW6_9HYPH|nr:hypothetical protein [Rhizobium paranaense]MBB5577583.1 hypothetical protein [Rhizobium paranaense]
MTLLSLDLRFGLQCGLHQDGIFTHHASLLDLQNLDQGSLLGELVFPGSQLFGNNLAFSGTTRSSIMERRLV